MDRTTPGTFSANTGAVDSTIFLHSKATVVPQGLATGNPKGLASQGLTAHKGKAAPQPGWSGFLWSCSRLDSLRLRAVALAAVALAAVASAADAQSANFQQIQQDRLKFVAVLRREQVIDRFTQLPDGSQCFIEVGSRFGNLPFERKVEAMSVPWTFCLARNPRAVEMPILWRSGNSHRQIGLFHKDGLSLF